MFSHYSYHAKHHQRISLLEIASELLASQPSCHHSTPTPKSERKAGSSAQTEPSYWYIHRTFLLLLPTFLLALLLSLRPLLLLLPFPFLANNLCNSLQHLHLPRLFALWRRVLPKHLRFRSKDSFERFSWAGFVSGELRLVR